MKKKMSSYALMGLWKAFDRMDSEALWQVSEIKATVSKVSPDTEISCEH